METCVRALCKSPHFVLTALWDVGPLSSQFGQEEDYGAGSDLSFTRTRASAARTFPPSPQSSTRPELWLSDHPISNTHTRAHTGEEPWAQRSSHVRKRTPAQGDPSLNLAWAGDKQQGGLEMRRRVTAGRCGNLGPQPGIRPPDIFLA